LRVDLTGHRTPLHVVEFVPEWVARTYAALPLAVDEGWLTLALPDPGDGRTRNDLAFIHNRAIDAVAAPADQLAAAIDRHYREYVPEQVITACFLGYDGGARE
jgi:type IV pilus assembly protein PilB